VAEPCPHCGTAFTLEKETKKFGTFRYCHRETCSWTNAPEGAPPPKKPKAMAPRPRRVPRGAVRKPVTRKAAARPRKKAAGESQG
jgi:hypothetical protein